MYPQESKLPVYQRMWSFMDQQNPSVFVKDSLQGIDRTLQGDYAFLMESTMIDYTMQRYCELMQVGGLLDSKGYGIATPIGMHHKSISTSKINNKYDTNNLHVQHFK